MAQLNTFGKLICGLSAFALFAGVNVAEAANFKNLSFQPNYIENHPVTKDVFFPFYEKVKADLNGEVTFNHFSNGQLYPESESYNVLNDGRVDFGVIRTGLFPGKMDALNVIGLPGLVPNGLVGALVNRDLLEKFAEVRDAMPAESVPFTIWTSAANQIHTNIPINSLADVKGKKLVVWDADGLEMAKLLGANPIRLSPPDTYLSLSKGMADGVIAPNAPLLSFKIAEVTKHHYMANLSVGTFSMAVFKPLWDDFPPEYQEYFKKAGHDMSEDVGVALTKGEEADIKWLKEHGHTIVSITPEESENMKAIFAPFKENWLAAMEKAGYTNGPEILAYAEERAKFHTDEFNKGTYGTYVLE